MHSKIIIALVLININSILYLDALTNPLLEGGLGSFYPPSLNLGDQKREKKIKYIMLKVPQSQTVFQSGLNLRKKVPNHYPGHFFFVWLVLRTVFGTFLGEICVKVKNFLRLGHL